MNKKIVAIMMSMIMVLSLVGCGGEATSASTEKEVNGTVSTKESVETNASANVSADKSENTDVNASTNTKVVTTATTQELDINNIVGQTLGEYVSALKKTPRYFLANYQDGCLDEVTELSMDALLQQEVIFAYVGENEIPCLGDKLLVMQIAFDDSILEMTFEDVINTINGCEIMGIMDLPENLAANSNATETQKTTFANTFESGKTVGELIDLTAYEAILGELEATKDDARELKDILPFEIYSVEPDLGLYNPGNMDGTSKSVLAGSIPGEMDSLLVAKMDHESTYAIISRFPYEANDSGNYCSYKDLGSFKVLYTGMTKEDAEMLGTYEAEYSGATFSWTVREEMIRNGNTSPKYFLFDRNSGNTEEFTGDNATLLYEGWTLYVHFGTEALPQGYDTVREIKVEMYDWSIEEMTYEEWMEKLEDSRLGGGGRFEDLTWMFESFE